MNPELLPRFIVSTWRFLVFFFGRFLKTNTFLTTDFWVFFLVIQVSWQTIFGAKKTPTETQLPNRQAICF